MLEKDLETEIIVLLGEVGGTMEHRAAAYIKEHMTKPVVALIVGRAAPEGAQMGHAGAIIEGEDQTAASKIRALKEAGVQIAHTPADIPLRIRELGVIEL
jgi:succinyl-CoA synthetase alpha subunit